MDIETVDETTLLSRLVCCSTDAMVCLHANCTVRYLNAAAISLFGYTASEACNHHPDQLWLPKAAVAAYELDMTVLHAGKIVEPFVGTWQHKDGTAVEVSVSMQALRDVTGAYLGAAMIVRDIRLEISLQRKLWEMQVRLLQATHNARTSILISRIVHEANQPLAVISLLAERLSVDQPKAAVIVAQVDRITQIMRYAHHEKVVRRPTPINQLIREAVELVTLSMQPGNIGINLELADDMVINIDKVQIEQVLVNLIRNAFDAMRTNGGNRLLVASSKFDDGLEITVIDDGPGINPAVAGRLFEPYVTSKSTGMGMGLAISHEIVGAHGGELTLRNIGDKGTCFVIRLPL